MTSVRCPHCGILHAADARTCPATGLALPQPSPSRRMVGPVVIPPAPAVPGRPAAPATSAPARHPGPPTDDLPPRRELIGRVIGEKYSVTGLIGEGGMGAVYEAEHLTVGRLVAIKVLHPRHAQKREAVVRLQHEARAVGSIGHPNICEVFDMGQLEDGSPYVVMERLHGETLAERIQREGPVPYQQLIDIVIDVLGALSAAHDKGILHRDLKPDNVFLATGHGPTPTIKLLDFGISKAMALEEPAQRLTRTGMVMGTPYYMAPEQARGDRGLDPRVDLWAVGVILYEALTTRRPFLARNYNALLVQILTVRHKPVSDLVPEVPQALSLLVDKALCKMREDRYQNAQEFRDRLLRFKGIMAAGGTQVFFQMPQSDPEAEERASTQGRVPGPPGSQSAWSVRDRAPMDRPSQPASARPPASSHPPPSSAQTLARDIGGKPSEASGPETGGSASRPSVPAPARSSTRGGRSRTNAAQAHMSGERAETATRVAPVRGDAPARNAGTASTGAGHDEGALAHERTRRDDPRPAASAASVPAAPPSQDSDVRREPETLPRPGSRAPSLRAPSAPPRPTPSAAPRPTPTVPPRPATGAGRKPATPGRGARAIENELSTPDQVRAPRAMPSDAAATATTRGAPQHLEASDTDDARVRVPPAPAMDPRSISESLSDEVEHAPRSVSDLVSTVALDGAEVPEDRRDQAQAPLDADAFLPAGDDGPTYVSSSPFELDIERTIVDPPSFITRGARSPDVADEESMPAPTSSDGGPVSSSTPSGRRKRKKP